MAARTIVAALLALSECAASSNAEVPKTEAAAQEAWERCTNEAIDHFATQPDPAEVVVTAATAACMTEETIYAYRMSAEPLMARVGTTIDQARRAIESTYRPSLLARVMANRALRERR